MTITVSDGETLSIPAGERTVSETINLSGSVTLDGTLDLQGTATEAAAGVGDGVGTATTTRTYTASNTPVQPIGVDRGETLAIAAGDERTAASVDLRGSITLDGTLSVVESAGTGTGYGRAVPDATADVTAAGDGEGLGTAIDGAFRAVIAAGDGDAVGSGTPIVAVPAVRREEATLVYDDREAFDLGLDS